MKLDNKWQTIGLKGKDKTKSRCQRDRPSQARRQVNISTMELKQKLVVERESTILAILVPILISDEGGLVVGNFDFVTHHKRSVVCLVVNMVN